MATTWLFNRLGYQFGDFAVQVQGGTSAFVAFSQQATQLAGILPMIASQVGLTVGVATILSSALMILIPIGSAIGRMFMEMGDSADGASKEVKTFEESLTSSRSAITAVDSAIQDLSDKSLESLRERYGEVTTQVLELEKALKRIEIKALTEEVQGAMNTLFTPEFFSQIESSFGKIGSAIVETTEEDLVDMRREIQLIQQLVDSDMFVSELDRKNLKEMNEELAAATGNFAKVGSLVDELSVPQDVLNTYLELELRIKEATKAGNFTVAADGISSMRKLFEDLGIEVETGALANMTRLEGVLREANDRLGKGTVLTRTMSKAFAANEASYQRYLDKIAKANASAEQELVLLTQKNVLLELERQYGKDSSIYNEMALDFEILNLRKKLEAKKIDETIIKGQIEALKIEKDITGQLANQLALKNVIVSKTRGNLEGLGIIEGSTVSREFYGDKRAAELRAEYEALGKETKKLNKGMTDADKAAEKLRKELESPMVNAIESVSNAFGDFIANGLKDFKGFASSILDSFKGMIAQMIATAARNKITLSLGMSGNGGGSVASQAGGSIIGGMAKSAFGSILQGGFTGASAFGHGVTTSLGLGSTINGTVASVLSPTMASVGSIVGSLAGPLLAVGAAFSFLRTKTKELDSGLRVTVDNMDVLVKSFKTIQKSRFFGLSKKVRTSEEEASSDISDPIVDAVVTIQESVMEAASAFGVASDKFNDFTYDFEVSLKGLTEDQKVEKLNEEFTKLGDTFTEMSELFTNMNDLLAVYQQRLELEKQLLVAQGDVVKLREQELETIHVLNRDLATRLHLLQAEGDMQSALTDVASGISEQQGLIRRAVDALVKPLQDAIDRTRTQAEKSYSIFKTAADKSVDSAKNIVDIITSALDSRTIISESAELMRYQTAQKQLASFAGGSEFDEASLRKATEGVSIDSQKFFGSFEDYARDFYRTQINLEDLAAVAEKELSEVEQQIDIAEKAYQVAMGTYQEAQDFNVALNNLLFDLALYNDVTARNQPFIDQIKQSGESQVAILEQLLEATILAFNPDASAADLVGNIMDVADAMGILKVTDADLDGAVVPTKEDSAGDIGSHMEGFDATLSKMYSDLGIDIETLKKLPQKLLDSEFFAPLAKAKITESFSDVDLTSTLLEKATDLANKAKEVGVEIFNADATIKTFTTTTNTTMGTLGEKLETALTGDGGLSSFIDQLKDSINGEGGLGSIVGSLTEAVNSLASSNNNLATAQQKASSASKIATITTEAAGIAAEISSIESSRGTTATGPSEDQKKLLAQLKQDLLDEENSNDKNLGTAHYRTLINNLNKKIAEENIIPAELSPGTSLALATLSDALDTLRKEVTDLGGTATFATGGYHSGGMRLVGENGPELEATGPSRIYSAQQTRNMLSGGSGEVVVELRSLRREVSELKAEQRKVGVENVKYNKKSYDLYREWDTVGLPATRTA